MTTRLITVGHSPDPDDAFMFYALAKHLLPTPGYEFEHILQDILGISTRAEHAVGDAEQPRAMALEFARTILHDLRPSYATSSP